MDVRQQQTENVSAKCYGVGDGKKSCIYLAFMAFGSGSAWIATGALFMEIPIYQGRFGLITANRMSIGYDLGALCVPGFLLLKQLFSFRGWSLNYTVLMTIMSATLGMTLFMAAQGISTLSGLIAISFFAGACGYLSSVIHSAYLIKHYQNVYPAAFTAGDSTSSVLAAVLAAVQQPQKEVAHGRRFGTQAFFLMLLPIVVVAYVAFLGIDYFRLGSLGHSLTAQLHTVVSPASARKSTSSASDDAAGSQKVKTGPSEDFSTWQVELAAPVHARVSEAKFWSDASKGMYTSVQQDEECGEVVNAHVSMPYLSQPLLASVLSLLGFCLSVSCWGIGDSIIPFACAQTSCLDGGKECVFHSNLVTQIACLLGPVLASCPAHPSCSMLWAPFFVYMMFFFVLCAAVRWGGSWAGPSFVIHGSDQCGLFIVLVVFFLRLLDLYMLVLRQRLIQLEFLLGEWDVVNSLFAIVSVVANLSGVTAASLFLQSHPK
jgi:hypothetical protein